MTHAVILSLISYRSFILNSGKVKMSGHVTLTSHHVMMLSKGRAHADSTSTLQMVMWQRHQAQVASSLFQHFAEPDEIWELPSPAHHYPRRWCTHAL